MKVVPDYSQVLLIGNADQLPSVDAANILRGSLVAEAAE
jgi:hypothetical protein